MKPKPTTLIQDIDFGEQNTRIKNVLMNNGIFIAHQLTLVDDYTLLHFGNFREVSLRAVRKVVPMAKPRVVRGWERCPSCNMGWRRKK